VTEALSLDPNVLLLDEPTNHLDSRNKKSLMRMFAADRASANESITRKAKCYRKSYVC
jgi:ATPase subunit of ABC transporter with duplicated ATPase domains